MVDGVLASCYASADHDLVQLMLMPIRWFLEWIEWIFGVYNGFQIYAGTIEHLAGWIMPHTLY